MRLDLGQRMVSLSDRRAATHAKPEQVQEVYNFLAKYAL
jgi:hypothetical protein